MHSHPHITTGFTTAQRAHGVVVSHPLRMRKALGSNPSGSTCLVHVCGQWHSLRIADASGLGAHIIVQTLSQTACVCVCVCVFSMCLVHAPRLETHAIPIHVHPRHHASVPCLGPGTDTLCIHMLSSSCPHICLSIVGHVLACRVALELGNWAPHVCIFTRETHVSNMCC